MCPSTPWPGLFLVGRGGVAVAGRAVAAGVLGLVQGPVRAVQQAAGRGVALIADAGGDRQEPDVPERLGRDGLPGPFRRPQGLGAVGLRQQPHELFAAEPGHDLLGAGHRPEPRRDRRQDHIARQVTVGVVDPLEVVDIQDDGAQARPAAPGQRNLFGEVPFQGPPVGQPAQGVGGGLELQVGPGLRVADGDLDELRELGQPLHHGFRDARAGLRGQGHYAPQASPDPDRRRRRGLETAGAHLLRGRSALRAVDDEGRLAGHSHPDGGGLVRGGEDVPAAQRRRERRRHGDDFCRRRPRETDDGGGVHVEQLADDCGDPLGDVGGGGVAGDGGRDLVQGLPHLLLLQALRDVNRHHHAGRGLVVGVDRPGLQPVGAVADLPAPGDLPAGEGCPVARLELAGEVALEHVLDAPAFELFRAVAEGLQLLAFGDQVAQLGVEEEHEDAGDASRQGTVPVHVPLPAPVGQHPLGDVRDQDKEALHRAVPGIGSVGHLGETRLARGIHEGPVKLLRLSGEHPFDVRPVRLEHGLTEHVPDMHAVQLLGFEPEPLAVGVVGQAAAESRVPIVHQGRDSVEDGLQLCRDRRQRRQAGIIPVERAAISHCPSIHVRPRQEKPPANPSGKNRQGINGQGINR